MLKYRCRDHFFPAVKIFPAIRRSVIFDMDFVINVVTAWIVNIGSRPIHTHSPELAEQFFLKLRKIRIVHVFKLVVGMDSWRWIGSSQFSRCFMSVMSRAVWSRRSRRGLHKIAK